MTKKTIWVVDDDVIYQIIANKIIKRSELFTNVQSFVNGKLAMDMLQTAVEKENETPSEVPDVILLDINMPVMDGWEFMLKMEYIKTICNKNIHIYIVSSSIAVEDKTKAKTYADILGYLSKPLTLVDLELIAAHE